MTTFIVWTLMLLLFIATGAVSGYRSRRQKAADNALIDRKLREAAEVATQRSLDTFGREPTSVHRLFNGVPERR